MMDANNLKRLATDTFGEKTKVLHGKFMVGNKGNQQILVGVCVGDSLAETDEYEAVVATVIVLIHRRGEKPLVNCSPEDFLENVQTYLPSKK